MPGFSSFFLKLLPCLMVWALLSCQQERTTELGRSAAAPAELMPDTSSQLPLTPALTGAQKDSLLQLQARELAQRYLLIDGHVDLPYRLQRKREDVSVRTTAGDFDWERAREGGLNAPFMSIYIPARLEGTSAAKSLAENLISGVEQLAKAYPDKFALARSPREVEMNFNAGLISLPMGMENGAPIGGNLQNLDYFYQRGIRYITLAHSKSNHISDSSYDPKKRWKGLSPFGQQLIQRMNELGMMIDVSHLSDSAFYQVMRLSKAPVIASHSSCRYFTPGFERNMSDEMIRLLAENGGVIMINFGSGFLTAESLAIQTEAKAQAEKWRQEQGLQPGDPAVDKYKEAYFLMRGGRTGVQTVAAHIDHVVKLVGPDHVGLGSDFEGVGDTLPEGLRDVSQYPNLLYELLKLGYSEDVLLKICSGNILRVWSEVEKSSSQQPQAENNI